MDSRTGWLVIVVADLTGQFLLTSAKVTEEKDDLTYQFSFQGANVAIGGVACLVCAVMICACLKSSKKEQPPKLQFVSKDGEIINEITSTQSGQTNFNDQKIYLNQTPVSSITLSGQPSPVTATPPLHRTANARVLPPTPVSEHRTKSKLFTGAEHPLGDVTGEIHHPNKNNSNIQYVTNESNSNNIRNEKKVLSKSQSDTYEHLGPKPMVRPSDYDSLDELKKKDQKSQIRSKSYHDDYSELEEKIYPGVDIGISSNGAELSESYCNVEDADNTATVHDNQVIVEDVYNCIGESDETVTRSVVLNLKQITEADNPYALVQDESAGDLRTALAGVEASGGTELTKINQAAPTNLPTSSNISHMRLQNGEDYAIVQKNKNKNEKAEETEELPLNEIKFSTDSLGPPEPPRLYSVSDSLGPPEPPRLYSVSDSLDSLSAVGASPKPNRTQNYSQVTARESLASISERKKNMSHVTALNMVENTYTMVDGWQIEDSRKSGASSGCEDNLFTVVNDTYDEIGACINTKNGNNTNHHKYGLNNPPIIISPTHPVTAISPALGYDNAHQNTQNVTNISGIVYSNQDNYENKTSGKESSAIKPDLHPSSLEWDKSREKLAKKNTQSVLCDSLSVNRERRLEDYYSDYDNVKDEFIAEPAIKNYNKFADDIKVVSAILDDGDDEFESSLHSLETKKIGQRRWKLD